MIQFTKFHASGNDFIIIKDIFNNIYLNNETIVNLCNRKYGIGADGIIIIKPDINKTIAKFYNRNASQPEMCVNGIRCIANFLKQIFPHKNTFLVQLPKRTVFVNVKKYHAKEKKALVEINLGSPTYNYYGKRIPKDKIIKVNTGAGVVEGYYISFDNPHFIIFGDQSDKNKLEEIAKELQKFFKSGINVEFTNAKSSKNINVLFWERGVGWTTSCGSGSCAVAAVLKRHKFPDAQVFYIKSSGGLIKVKVDKSFNTFLEGYSYQVFEGII